MLCGGLPGGSVVKNLPANTGDMGLILGLGRSPGEGNGNPLQYSCLENPMDGPNPGIKSRSPVLQADSLPSEPPGKFLWLSFVYLAALVLGAAYEI